MMMGRSGCAARSPCSRQAVQTGKHQVQEHQVDLARERGLESGAAVMFLPHLVASPFQVVRDQIGDGDVVFHQQDAFLFRFSHPSSEQEHRRRQGGPHN